MPSRSVLSKIGLLFVFGFLFFLPDALYALADARFPICLNIEKFLLVFGLGVLISLTVRKKVVYGYLALFAVMNLIQFCCMAYFGTYLSPFAVDLLFVEAGDVFQEVGHMVTRLWWIPVVTMPPYAVYAYVIHKTEGRRFCFKFGWVLFILFFAGFMARANTFSGAHQMLFKRTCYASFNTMNAFTGYFGNILPRSLLKTQTVPVFKPYTVTKTPDDTPMTVFVVYGESVNRHHMSLFGYERDTTPLLKKRRETDKNFVASEAYSAAVNTLISIPTFLHLQREPENFKKQVEADTYLPRLAKDNGFTTNYIGFQGESVRQKSALSYIDNYLIYEAGDTPNEEQFFLDAVKKVDFSKRTFVFLNKRNLHTPFARNYLWAHDKFSVFPTEGLDDKTYRLNSYDNAMLYEDYLLDSMMNWLRDNVKTPVYFYFIGDHGEAFGENGIYGHGALVSSIFHVPFIFNAFNGADEAYVTKVKNTVLPTAFEVGVLIAEKMGQTVKNPNNTDDTYFVNGGDLMGRAGYVRLKKDAAAKTMTETLVEKQP